MITLDPAAKLLPGHVSPETAYVVDDYPYGFRLRCKIRYWLETHKRLGVRMVSQTSNPKVAGLVWNKPKASTYCKFAGAMYLDFENHVQWSGLHDTQMAPNARHGVISTVRQCPKRRAKPCTAGAIPKSPMTPPASRAMH